VDPVPDPLLLRKSGSAGNRTRDLCLKHDKSVGSDLKILSEIVTTTNDTCIRNLDTDQTDLQIEMM
jgi:hypothetical protein